YSAPPQRGRRFSWRSPLRSYAGTDDARLRSRRGGVAPRRGAAAPRQGPQARSPAPPRQWQRRTIGPRRRQIPRARGLARPARDPRPGVQRPSEPAHPSPCHREGREVIDASRDRLCAASAPGGTTKTCGPMTMVPPPGPILCLTVVDRSGVQLSRPDCLVGLGLRLDAIPVSSGRSERHVRPREAVPRTVKTERNRLRRLIGLTSTSTVRTWLNWARAAVVLGHPS